MSLRSGWIVDLSALPSPMPSRRVGICSACRGTSTGSSLAKILRMICNVFARPFERPRIGLPVPAFNYLRAGGADAEDEAAAREVVERHRRHRGGRGRARGELSDGGAELDAATSANPTRRAASGIRAVGLGRPDRVESEAFGLSDGLLGCPVAGRHSSSRWLNLTSL